MTYWTAHPIHLDFNKCRIISFSRKHEMMHFQYFIGNSLLRRSTFVADLGVILDNRLVFHQQIDAIARKVNHMLGFIMRATFHFSSNKSILARFSRLGH